MKSKLLIATALFCGISVMAQEDVQIVQFTATSANNTAGDKVNLLVGSGFTTDFDNDYDKSKKMGSAESPTVINFYAYCAGWLEVSPKYAANAAEPVADGQPFVFESNDLDTEYTITFSIKQGTPKWYFYDAQLDSATLITDGGTYVFTQAVSTKAETRFRIQAPEFKICTTYDAVEIYGNEGTDNIVITTLANDTIVNVAPVEVFQTIDLSDKAAGHYVLTVNGTQYEFCNKPVSDN